MSIGKLLGRAFAINSRPQGLEEPGAYYASQLDSKILKPCQKDGQKEAIENNIMNVFLDLRLPSWEAMGILKDLEQKVISYQNEMELRYYREKKRNG